MRGKWTAEQSFWDESLSEAFDSANIYPLYQQLTDEQRISIADALAVAHENYGMAFYSPPSSDRYNQIEREWKAKYDALRAEFDSYQNNAETAVKQALRQPRDATVSIGKHGEVLRYGGRTVQIQ